MKYITVILTIFLLLYTSTVIMRSESSSLGGSSLEKKMTIQSMFSELNQNKEISIIQKFISSFHRNRINYGLEDFSFCPEDIELSDDGFHGSYPDFLPLAEWWYFDAVFNNGYSAQMSIIVFSQPYQDSILFSILNIYRDTELISHKQSKHFLENFSIHSADSVETHGSKSSSFLGIGIDEKKIIDAYVNTYTGNWEFSISLDMGDTAANLLFVGETKGFKGFTPISKWAVILPRAQVSGKLYICGEEILVSGIGYHDHNWEVTLGSIINFGWYWGRINSDSYTITWAEILKTWFLRKPLIVINDKNGGYRNIESNDIEITAGDFKLTNWLLVPHSFDIVVQTENVSIKVHMQALNTHHNMVIPIMNYWRYHMKCNGYITVESQTEIIDDVAISEFLKFGPY